VLGARSRAGWCWVRGAGAEARGRGESGRARGCRGGSGCAVVRGGAGCTVTHGVDNPVGAVGQFR
jgi:hypothetical protein